MVVLSKNNASRSRSGDKAVTLADIAGVLGVSRALVSSVLGKSPNCNGTIRVSQERRNEIITYARQCGYVPNVLARSLRIGKSHAVGMLWALGGPPTSSKIVNDLSMAIKSHGYLTYPISSMSDPDIVVKSLTELKGRGVDGIILQGFAGMFLPEYILDTLQTFRAVVLVSLIEDEKDYIREKCQDTSPIDIVYIDRFTAIRAIVDHFVDTGRVMPAIGIASTISDMKVQVFRDQLNERGLELPDDRILCCGNQVQPEIIFHEKLKGYISRTSRMFDSIWCSNDNMAIAAMSRLKSSGYSIPEDIAVAGYDDNPFTRFTDPPLASVTTYNRQLVSLIENMLFARFSDMERPMQVETLQRTFVLRESAD